MRNHLTTIYGERYMVKVLPWWSPWARRSARLVAEFTDRHDFDRETERRLKTARVYALPR